MRVSQTCRFEVKCRKTVSTQVLFVFARGFQLYHPYQFSKVIIVTVFLCFRTKVPRHWFILKYWISDVDNPFMQELKNEKFLHSGTLSRTMNPTNYEQFQNYNILVSLFYSWNRLSIWTTFSTQIANPTLPALLNSTWRLASTFPGGFAEIHNIA